MTGPSYITSQKEIIRESFLKMPWFWHAVWLLSQDRLHHNVKPSSPEIDLPPACWEVQAQETELRGVVIPKRLWQHRMSCLCRGFTLHQSFSVSFSWVLLWTGKPGGDTTWPFSPSNPTCHRKWPQLTYLAANYCYSVKRVRHVITSSPLAHDLRMKRVM